MQNSNPSSHKLHWKWLIPAIITVITAILGLSGNLVANDLEKLFGDDYRWIIWIIFAIALVITVVNAIIEARQQKEPTASGSGININAPRGNISITGDIIGRDKNIGGDLVGRDKIDT